MALKRSLRKRRTYQNVLFILLAILFIVGCVFTISGIWMIVERTYIAVILNNALLTASVALLVAVGCFSMIVAMIGSCGLWTENRLILRVFVAVGILISLAAVASIILAIMFRIQINSYSKFDMQISMQREYGVLLDRHKNRLTTYAWDTLQSVMQCCSIEDASWVIYRSAEWFKIEPGEEGNSKPLVPASCCVRDQRGYYVNQRKCQYYTDGPPYLLEGTNEALYGRGCYQMIEVFAFQYGAIIAGLSLLLICYMVIVLTFAVLLMHQLS